ncbi:MAG: ABC transporter ATP-binding protein [Propioniciclava sp.]
MLQISDVGLAYGDHSLWQGVEFTVQPGEMTAVIGPSGSGKSSLLNCVGMLVKPDSGAIMFEGADLVRFGGGQQRQFRRAQLGYLFQNYALMEDASVTANLLVATRAARLRRRAAVEAMEEALAQVGLAGMRSHRVAQLSGGEQQRVAMARLLVRSPRLVLADEPTGALDADNRAVVMSHLRRLAEAGAVVLVATHDDTVRHACDTTLDLVGYQ